jgi:L-threonylcarbamoyladenylate synthase
MNILKVNANLPDRASIEKAANVIRDGGLVAFPTEKVYGLGANALDSLAVRRIFEAKGRPFNNPLIAHVPDVSGARRMVAGWPEIADRLADAFWPGPLTLILDKLPFIPDEVTAGLPTVAVRVPAHPVALALLRTVRVPIAAPSANRFTGISPTTAQHVASGIGEHVDLLLDGGPTPVGIESAVLDLSRREPVLLRPGTLSLDALEAVAGRIMVPQRDPLADEPRPSPGMMERHYAPRARVHVFRGDESADAVGLAGRVAASGEIVGALVFRPLPGPIHHEFIMPAHATAYAERLYAALHSLDERRCDLILIEDVPDRPAWDGVRDRLRRAATPGL